MGNKVNSQSETEIFIKWESGSRDIFVEGSKTVRTGLGSWYVSMLCSATNTNSIHINFFGLEM